jgi:hypothetical protein
MFFKNPKTGGSYDFEIIKRIGIPKTFPKKNNRTRGSLNSKIKEILESEVINKI